MLTAAEEDQVTGWLDDAAIIIDAWVNGTAPDPVPNAYERVSINMALRALRQAALTPGVQMQQQTAGPFSQITQFPATMVPGGVWLSATDKLMLRPYKSVVSLQVTSERT